MIVALALAAALLFAAPDTSVTAGDEPVLVETDLGRVRALVTGQDAPAVVLLSGLGDGLEVWADVRRALGTDRRVLAYDRAGLGGSEPSTAARTPRRIATELHGLLAALEVPPPYVLVGHSVGALHARAFAALYPDEVAGFVLVDPSHELQERRFAALSAERCAEERRRLEAFYASRSAAIRAEWRAVKTVVDEGALEGASRLPDVPTVLLTATRADPEADWIGQTPEGIAAWTALHAELVAPLDRALHVQRAPVGHYMHREDPALVAAAITELCRAVVEGRAPSREALPPEPGAESG